MDNNNRENDSVSVMQFSAEENGDCIKPIYVACIKIYRLHTELQKRI